MKKPTIFAVLTLVTISTEAQTSKKLCSPHRVDKPCSTVQKNPYRIDIKKPETRIPTFIRSTGPSGQVDFSKRQWKIVGKTIYQLGPSGLIDYSAPKFRIVGNRIFQLRPSGTIDYSKPSYLIG